MTSLLFPADTLCPLPHKYTERVKDGWLVKVGMMQEWELDCWKMAMEAIREAK